LTVRSVEPKSGRPRRALRYVDNKAQFSSLALRASKHSWMHPAFPEAVVGTSHASKPEAQAEGFRVAARTRLVVRLAKAAKLHGVSGWSQQM